MLYWAKSWDVDKKPSTHRIRVQTMTRPQSTTDDSYGIRWAELRL